MRTLQNNGTNRYNVVYDINMNKMENLKIISWNVNGFNSAPKRKQIAH